MACAASPPPAAPACAGSIWDPCCSGPPASSAPARLGSDPLPVEGLPRATGAGSGAGCAHLGTPSCLNCQLLRGGRVPGDGGQGWGNRVAFESVLQPVDTGGRLCQARGTVPAVTVSRGLTSKVTEVSVLMAHPGPGG